MKKKLLVIYAVLALMAFMIGCSGDTVTIPNISDGHRSQDAQKDRPSHIPGGGNRE